MSEERGRLRPGHRLAAGRRVPARRHRRRRRSGRGQHLRVHRGSPPGVHRHHPGLERQPTFRRRARGHRLHGRALRRRTGRSASRGRPGGRLRRPHRLRPARLGPCHHRRPPRVRVGGARLRPAQHAPPRTHRAVGLHQGGRGLRPGLWVLRHPVVPGQATVTGPLGARRRGPPPRRRRRARDRARRPGSRQLRPRPGRGQQADRAPRRRDGEHRRPGPPAVPVPLRAHRRADRRHLPHRRAVLRPVAAARVPAADPPDAALGRRVALPRTDTDDQAAATRRRVPLELHRRLPRRDRGRPRRPPRLRRGGRARLVRLLLLLRGGGNPRRRPRRRGARCARHRPPPRTAGHAGRHHRRPARPTRGTHGVRAGRRAGHRSIAPGSTRDRRCRPHPGHLRGRHLRRRGGPLRRGSRRARRGSR